MQGPPAETKIIGLNPGSISAGLEGLYKPIRFNKMRFNKIYYSKLFVGRRATREGSAKCKQHNNRSESNKQQQHVDYKLKSLHGARCHQNSNLTVKLVND